MIEVSTFVWGMRLSALLDSRTVKGQARKNDKPGKNTLSLSMGDATLGVSRMLVSGVSALSMYNVAQLLVQYGL